ncbi:PD40 domain-containing protein [Candidatus Poribacteria bacterium]|nr:PD40 domain-containing protein [Candidatus Poribacteria bacterium]
MKSSKRILLTVIFWSVIGCLLIANLSWAKDYIIYTIGGDGVYAIKTNGTKPTKLFDAPAARPSHDGRYLAVWRPGQVLEICETGTGKRIKEIRLDVQLYWDFAWSPDGKWIAYLGLSPGISEIFLISVQSGEVRQLTSHQRRLRRLVWAPDSRSIFYMDFNTSRTKYWEVDIPKPRRPKEYNLFHKGAAFLGTPGAFFSFSHDGKHIAYGSAAGDGGVYVAKANSTNHRRLNPNGSYRTYRVAWSPDDNYIAFFSYYHETRSSVLYTISRHTSKMRRLVEIPNAAYGLTWADVSALSVEPVGKLTTIWGELKR